MREPTVEDVGPPHAVAQRVGAGLQLRDRALPRLPARQQRLRQRRAAREAQRDADRPLIKQVTREVINMPDREALIAELKAKIEAGEYNPTGDDIADAMIRRNIADHCQ